MITTQLFCGSKPEESKITLVKNRSMFPKPDGGLWTSTYIPPRMSSWIYWCKMADFRKYSKGEFWKVSPQEDIRCATIDTLGDLRALEDSYTAEPIEGFPKLTLFSSLDFEKLSQDYDVIHLTENGEGETRYSMPGFYGWDCESVLWLNWKIASVEALY
jgi:hypothetical protein